MTLKINSLFCSLVFPALLLVSCNGNFLDTPVADPQDTFSARAEEISVEAASFYEMDLVTGFVRFTSSLSWRASLPEGCEWMEINGREEELNLSGQAREYEVQLILNDNLSSEERSGSVTIHTGIGEKKVRIRQEALSPVLSLVSPEIVNVPCDGGDVEITVRSNVEWRVSVGEGATAIVTPEITEGYKTYGFSLNVFPNVDEENGKTATIIISAEGCESVSVVINQAKYTV